MYPADLTKPQRNAIVHLLLEDIASSSQHPSKAPGNLCAEKTKTFDQYGFYALAEDYASNFARKRLTGWLAFVGI